MFNTTESDLLIRGFFSYESFEKLILANGWFAWAILPYICANVGFWVPVIVLEMVNKPGLTKKVTYGKRRRSSILAEFHREKMSFSSQVINSFWEMSGLPMMINSAFSKVVFSAFFPSPEAAFPGWFTFAKEVLFMLIAMDFLIYWVHRACHLWDFLWKYHETHHEMTVVSPVSAGHVHFVDAVIAGALPIYLSGLIVRPHPVANAASILLLTADLVTVHCGLDSFWVDFFTLRHLPGRNPIANHDHHHHYSHYMGKAKNFGHLFWVWDWAFGSLPVRTERSELDDAIDAKSD